MSRSQAAIALAGLTLIRLIMAARLPLSPDEAYYWLWSQHLQAGYFDHPPMVAFWIAAGTAIFGKTALGVRFLGPLAAAGGSILLWDAGEHLFPNRQAGFTTAALFNATLIAGAGAILITPDTPLLFFWAACFAAIGRWLATGNPRWWLAIGATAGAALLSKYTGLILIAGIGLWLVSGRDGRRALASPWPWCGLAIALAVFTPNIVWNAAHGWVSYFKQGSRVTEFNLARSAQFLAELIIGQFGLATPLIAALCVAGLWRLRTDARLPARLLLWLALLPAAIFLEHVISGRVELNWPAIMFIPACLAAAALQPAPLRRWRLPAIALGLVCNLAVYAQAMIPLFPIPAGSDPVALQLAGWSGLSAELAGAKPAFLTSEDYTTLSELAWAAPPGIPIIAAGRRWQFLSLPPAPKLGLGISASHRPYLNCPAPLGTLPRNRDNYLVMNYSLCHLPLPDDAWLVAGP